MPLGRAVGRAALVLMSVPLAFGITEVAARLALDPVSPGNFTPIPRSITTASPFPGLPYLLKPNSEVTVHFDGDPQGYFDEGGALTYSINSRGFRTREFNPRNKRGAFRVVGLGDSFTFGTGVRQEHTFLAQLQQSVDPEASRVEVLNLGVMAYNTPEEVALLRHVGLKLNPDLIVLCFFLNDTGTGGGTTGFFNTPPGATKPWWRRASRALDHAAHAVGRKESVQQMIDAYRTSFEPDAPGWVRAKTSLRQARQLTKERDVPLVLMIFPILWNLGDDYPFRGVHDTIIDAARDLDLPVLDLEPAFRGHHGPSLWCHPTNQHPNLEGHAIAAEALERFLVDQDLLPR